MPAELRILYITLRADHGGGPKHLYDLLTILPDFITPFVAAPADKPYYTRFTELAGEESVVTVPHRQFTFNTLLMLRDFCSAHKIDIIHSHGKGAGIYSRLLNILTGIPVIHTFHGVHIDNYSALNRKLYLLLERVFSFFTASGIAVSYSEYRRIQSLGFFPVKKLHTVHNGVQLPAGVTARPLTKGIKNIIHITRFDFAKDPDLLFGIIEAMKDEHGYKFIIIGDGEGRAAFENRLLKKQLAHLVHFTGFVDAPEQYFSDAFCYLSTSRWEGLPLSVLEAMARGIPAVLSNVTGNSDCIEDGVSGYLYNREYPAEAVAKIKLLTEENGQYTKFSAAARSRVEQNYSLKLMGNNTINLYLALPLDI